MKRVLDLFVAKPAANDKYEREKDVYRLEFLFLFTGVLVCSMVE